LFGGIFSGGYTDVIAIRWRLQNFIKIAFSGIACERKNEVIKERQGGVSMPQHAGKLFDSRSQTGAGVYDGLSALMAAKWNFDFLWVSSFCCSAAVGLPDVGIIGVEEMLSTVRTVRRCTALPIVVDLDSGYGDAIKVYSVVEAMAGAGAAALCIEDNPLSKRCSLYGGYDRTLVTIEEHVTRVRAALEAVRNNGSDCKIIARTEALVAGLGIEEALRRTKAYADAGADAIFIQSLDATGDEVLTFAREWKRRTPIFIAPTRMPDIDKQQFFDAGISHFIFANHGLRAAYAAMDRVFGILSGAASSGVIEKEIAKVTEVGTLVGAQKIQDLEALLGIGNKSKIPHIVETSNFVHSKHPGLTSTFKVDRKAGTGCGLGKK
jgi:phosphoenolpyruvate phosphomutase